MVGRTESGHPLADLGAETQRIAAAFDRGDLPLRLIGGAAIWLRCPSARHAALRREYADLDFIGLGTHSSEVKRFFDELGYTPDKFFNSLHGRTRLLYQDEANARQVDVFFDEMLMCHRLDFRARVRVDTHTLPLADLLLTKLQIVQLNPKDLTDLVTLLIDHPLGDHDGDNINVRYVADLAAGDWGLYRTIQLSLDRVRASLGAMPEVGRFRAVEQIDALWSRIEAAPKTLKWKLRARVGDRMRWYEEPEEVKRD